MGHLHPFLRAHALVDMRRDLGLRDFSEAGIQREVGKADPDVGVATEVTLEIVEVLPVFHELRSVWIGIPPRIKDFRVVEDASGIENSGKFPHGPLRIGEML